MVKIDLLRNDENNVFLGSVAKGMKFLRSKNAIKGNAEYMTLDSSRQHHEMKFASVGDSSINRVASDALKTIVRNGWHHHTSYSFLVEFADFRVVRRNTGSLEVTLMALRPWQK